MFELATHFSPAWWLPEGHSQTLWRKFRPDPQPQQSRERVELDDGDFIDIDWCTLAGVREESGEHLVVILHGLCGCSQSPYVVALQAQLAGLGISSAAVNFRGCSGESNRLARSYHSGVSDDVAQVFSYLSSHYPGRRFSFVGFSLGANVLLKWLGEIGGTSEPLHKAVAVSTPFQLQHCSAAMIKGMSRMYGQYFVRLLTETFQNKLDGFIKAGNNAAAQQLRELGPLDDISSIWDFDERITAPLHGFRDAEHYYQSCSSAQFLPEITVETLLIQSKDDPLIPPKALPQPGDLSDKLTMELFARGGHVGFIAGGATDWLERRIAAYLAS